MPKQSFRSFGSYLSFVVGSDRTFSLLGRYETYPTLKDKTFLIIRDSFPPVLAFLINQLVLAINLHYVGTLNDTEIFDGVGFGTAWIALTNTAVIVSLNIGFLAIASQAYGNNNNELVGLSYHRAIIIAIMVFIPCSLFIIFSKNIIIMLNVSPSIAHYATDYMISLLPAIFIFIFIDTTKNFLFAQNHFFVPAIIQLIVSLIHPFWCELFLALFDIGFYSISWAFVITQALNLGILMAYTHIKELGGGCWFWFNKKSFEKIGTQFIKEFFIGSLLYLDLFAYECCLIIAGSLSELEIAAQIIFFTFQEIIYSIPYGFAVAFNTHLANSVGKGAKEEIIQFIKAGLISFMIIVIITELIFYFLIEDFVILYTSQSEIQSLIKRTCHIFMFFIPFDYLQLLFSAVLRAIGKERIGTLIFVIAFYGIGLPISYLLAITLELSIPGLWIGVGTGASILVVEQLLVFRGVNLEKQIMAIIKEMDDDQETYKEFELTSL